MRTSLVRNAAFACCLAVAVSEPNGAHAQPPPIPGPRLGGYLQTRQTFAEPIGWSATLNRVRLSADGQLPNRFTYRTLVEFQAGATARTPGLVSLREAIIRWSLAPWAAQAGQFKTPFSREYLIPVPALETADFSAVVDTLAPKYDIGVMGEYSVPFLAVSSAGMCSPAAVCCRGSRSSRSRRTSGAPASGSPAGSAQPREA